MADPPMPSADTEALHLPDPRHASRIPAGIEPGQVERIRRAAYTLPQVVGPGEFDDPGAPASERTLDEQGYLLLQKAAGELRPSRWIAPADLAAALAHLDVVGAGRGVRPKMAART